MYPNEALASTVNIFSIISCESIKVYLGNIANKDHLLYVVALVALAITHFF